MDLQNFKRNKVWVWVNYWVKENNKTHQIHMMKWMDIASVSFVGISANKYNNIQQLDHQHCCILKLICVYVVYLGQLACEKI